MCNLWCGHRRNRVSLVQIRVRHDSHFTNSSLACSLVIGEGCLVILLYRDHEQNFTKSISRQSSCTLPYDFVIIPISFLLQVPDMNVLGLDSYESDEETGANEEPMQLSTNEIIVAANICEDLLPADRDSQPRNDGKCFLGAEVKEIIVDAELSYPTSASLRLFNHLHELPPSPKKSSNPKTIRKISEYLELKEISGFNLTEVCHKYRIRILRETSMLFAIVNLLCPFCQCGDDRKYRRIYGAIRTSGILTSSAKPSSIFK